MQLVLLQSCISVYLSVLKLIFVPAYEDGIDQKESFHQQSLIQEEDIRETNYSHSHTSQERNIDQTGKYCFHVDEGIIWIHSAVCNHYGNQWRCYLNFWWFICEPSCVRKWNLREKIKCQRGGVGRLQQDCKNHLGVWLRGRQKIKCCSRVREKY